MHSEDTFTNLVHNYLPLAQKIAKSKESRYWRLMTPEEVASAAYWGLLTACQKYSHLPDTQFVGVAATCILNEIWDAAREEIRHRKKIRGGDKINQVQARTPPDTEVLGGSSSERDIYKLVCIDGLTKTEASRELGLPRRCVHRSLVRLWHITTGEDQVERKRSA